MKVSVILPVHNEGAVLEKNVRRLEKLLTPSLGNFEIVISEDGSTDGTPGISRGLESERIRVFNHPERLGKGNAIKKAAGLARNDIIIFMDADLASDPNFVKSLLGEIDGGADIVIGSRYLRESKARRSFVRYMASRSFNFLVRAMLGSKLTDHQCGFKAFRKGPVLPIINEIDDGRWFWDTELLVRAQRKGLKVAEIPIEWKEAPGSKFRLLQDTVHMACSLVSFKLKHG
ncbi:MAG TPA: glycosyltransferase [Candidatus Bilamarchaeum sp.]|nr:glycosyltransferase [Candidatus Bilamarchaeum sp.]